MKKCMTTYIIDNKNKIFFAFAVLLVPISFFIGMYVSSVHLSISEIFEAFSNIDSPNGRIVLYIRLPRVIATLLAGSALAVSGVIVQSVLHNNIASPNIIGVNSGAGFGVVLTLAIFPLASSVVLGFSAILGALLAMLIIYSLAKLVGASKTTLVLGGIAVSAILSAGIDAITITNTDILTYANVFKIGGFSGITYENIYLGAIAIPLIILIVILFAKELEILNLGEEIAMSLGLKVGVFRFLFLFLAACLAGIAVSFSGLIGFVGLIIPHLVKYFTNGNMRITLLGATIVGSSFLCICDAIARVLLSPYELPVGIILAFIGAPFFLFIMFRRKKNA